MRLPFRGISSTSASSETTRVELKDAFFDRSSNHSHSTCGNESFACDDGSASLLLSNTWDGGDIDHCCQESIPLTDVIVSPSPTSSTGTCTTPKSNISPHSDCSDDNTHAKIHRIYKTAVRDLQNDLRDKLNECEALYETAAALSQALQESDRLLQMERTKNEKLLLKLSMICMFEEFNEEDDDQIRDVSSSSRRVENEQRKSNVRILQNDVGESKVDVDEEEDMITTELRLRAKRLTKSILKSPQTNRQEKNAALTLHKQMSATGAGVVVIGAKTGISAHHEIKSDSNNKEVIKQRNIPQSGMTPVSRIVDVDDFFPGNEGSKVNDTTELVDKCDTQQELSSSLQPHGSIDQTNISTISDQTSDQPLSTAEEDCKHDDHEDISADLKPQDETEDKRVIGDYMDDTSAVSVTNADGITPTSASQESTITSATLPCQANFYQVILERDVALANVRRLTRELTNTKTEMRSIKSRLDVSTALVKISYSETSKTPVDKCEIAGAQTCRSSDQFNAILINNKTNPNNRNRDPKSSSCTSTAQRRRGGWIRTSSGRSLNLKQQSQQQMQLHERIDENIEYDGNFSKGNYFDDIHTSNRKIPQDPSLSFTEESTTNNQNQEEIAVNTDDRVNANELFVPTVVYGTEMEDDDEYVRKYINAIESASGTCDADKAGGNSVINTYVLM